MDQPHISAENLTMAYGDFLIQRGLNFSINHGDIFIIMGGSACGKSTLLKIMIGLKSPATGEVYYDGQAFWQSNDLVREETKRKFGTLFQSGALWSSMTLAEPIGPALRPRRMPDYLNRSQLVTRGPGAEVRVDEFNRWTEPPGQSLLRIVAADLDAMVDGLVVFMFPYESFIRSEVDYRLVGDVNRFDADAAGRVVLEEQWGIARVGGGMVVAPRRSQYRAKATTAGDPAARVTAINQTLAEFAGEIADAIRPVLQSSDSEQTD